MAEEMQPLSARDIGLDLGAGHILEVNMAGLGSQQAGDGPEQAGLAGAVRPRQRRRFPAFQAEAQALEQLAFAARQRQVFDGKPPDHQSRL